MVSGYFFALSSHSAKIFPHLTGVSRTSLRTLFALPPCFFALFVHFFALYLHFDIISSHFSRFSSHYLCTLFALLGGFFALCSHSLHSQSVRTFFALSSQFVRTLFDSSSGVLRYSFGCSSTACEQQSKKFRIWHGYVSKKVRRTCEKRRRNQQTTNFSLKIPIPLWNQVESGGISRNYTELEGISTCYMKIETLKKKYQELSGIRRSSRRRLMQTAVFDCSFTSAGRIIQILVTGPVVRPVENETSFFNV
jgi:hypothetical protein